MGTSIPPKAGLGALSSSKGFPSEKFENKARRRGFRLIAGVDEAGRGPLAGPVVAAAVILPKNFKLSGLNDSKKLTPKNRQKIYETLKKQAVAIGVGKVSPKVIDRINILRATLLAMRKAVLKLRPKPHCLLIDGRDVIPALNIPQQSIPRGDGLSNSIAAASVIAKVVRDKMMTGYDKKYPQYGFGKHKGYGTKEHLEALKKYGPGPLHRKSFAPCSKFRHFAPIRSGLSASTPS